MEIPVGAKYKLYTIMNPLKYAYGYLQRHAVGNRPINGAYGLGYVRDMCRICGDITGICRAKGLEPLPRYLRLNCKQIWTGTWTLEIYRGSALGLKCTSRVRGT